MSEWIHFFLHLTGKADLAGFEDPSKSDSPVAKARETLSAEVEVSKENRSECQRGVKELSLLRHENSLSLSEGK